MLKKSIAWLAVASSFASSMASSHANGFADSVASYTPGTGVNAGYDQPNAALGELSRVTPGQFGGPVDPFNPPYLGEQVVSIGAGGSLTLQFSSPVYDDAAHAFGIDFIIFGNAGFQIVNGDFSGGGITDGSLLGASTGQTQVSVSKDGQTFYPLSPSLAPVVDGPFPTDGSGNPFAPLDPALKQASFAGKNLAGIRQLYNGSAGGAGYDISWAQATGDRTGFVQLGSIQYIRIDVLSGIAEVDAVAAVPEPGILTLGGVAAVMFFQRRRG